MKFEEINYPVACGGESDPKILKDSLRWRGIDEQPNCLFFGEGTRPHRKEFDSPLPDSVSFSLDAIQISTNPLENIYSLLALTTAKMAIFIDCDRPGQASITACNSAAICSDSASLVQTLVQTFADVAVSPLFVVFAIADSCVRNA